MARSYTIVEKSQNRSFSIGAGWWFVLQGKFDEMAMLAFADKEGTVELQDKTLQPVTVADTQVRNGVLSVKLDGVDGQKVARQAKLTLGE